MSVANVSQHLQTLLNAHLVVFEKKGNFVIYELADEVIAEFLMSFHTLSERQFAQVQQIKQEFMNANLGMDGISLEELNERMAKGEVLLLDVRPKEEFEKAHTPGAISAPMEDRREQLSTLPTNSDAVACSRGP